MERNSIINYKHMEELQEFIDWFKDITGIKLKSSILWSPDFMVSGF